MNQQPSCSSASLISALCRRPQAEAVLEGSGQFPEISGTVRFYQTNEGVVVYARVTGLPHDGLTCHERIFGFHVHEGTDCAGSGEDRFADSMAHYDSGGCGHPYHAGDLPPLFGNDGVAETAFLTGRFLAEDIIGRTVIIHEDPDDFTTQPSGGSGTKIACGVIRRASGC